MQKPSLDHWKPLDSENLKSLNNVIMKQILNVIVLLSLLVLGSCNGGKKTTLTVPYQKYKLPNGLTVILNPDKSDPIASLAILYHVGSNREVPGKTGFAHLFEHMMFQRSENVGEDQYFKYIEGAGGQLNGGTSFDQTIYFEVVPKNALELAMWLESDRMGYLINTVTPQSFAGQQNVVQNEKRQGVDNRPYGFTESILLKSLYPQGHPYSWDVIGEMEDLKNATIEDVKAFHNKFYVPNNATLVVSGDYDSTAVKTMIDKYFGEIPSGGEIRKMDAMNVTLDTTKKLYHEDNFARVPQLNMVFPVPQMLTRDSYSLDVLAQLLGLGKKSPMYKVLVKDKKLTSSVSVFNNSQELAGEFRINVTASPDTSLDKVEKAIFESFEKFEKEGFTENDLERIKAKLETDFYSKISSVMYKSFMLAYYDAFAGSPDYLMKEVEVMRSVTRQDVIDVYNKYIKGKNYVETSFVPKGQLNLIAQGAVSAGVVEEDITKATQVKIDQTAEEVIQKTPSKIDRSTAPVTGDDPAITIPSIWKSEASNGMKIFGIEQHEVPLVTYDITIKGGHMLDDLNKPGVARFTASMLNEGTKNLTPEELEEAIQRLGADISIRASDEDITVSVSCLARNFEKTLALVEEMLLQPRWDEEQFALNKTRTINNLKRNMSDPNYLAYRALDKLICGDNNILSTDVPGTVQSVATITLDDLKAFYDKNISPSAADFLVVGDVDKAKVEKALTSLNSKWTAKEVSLPVLTFPAVPDKATLYFVDVPNSKQSVINIGYLALPRNHPDFYKAEVTNYMLGGTASAKLFMVLREEKGFTYGAYSGFSGMEKYGTFSANAAVRSDATLESVTLFKDIMQNYRTAIPQETVDFTKASLLKGNALRFETIGSLLDMLNTMASNNLPEDYIKQEESYLKGLTGEKMLETAKKYIDPMKMNYVVVGDAKSQLKPLEKAGLGKPVMFSLN
jgi:zinc protease